MPSDGEIRRHAGAGTHYVYKLDDAGPSRRRPHDSFETERSWSDLIDQAAEEASRLLNSPDSLLERGIADYTFLPVEAGGLLGRGKFSTVYKVLRQDGKLLALKHTPLHPHHPLIAARLLREPTLLAELPRHPCLIGMEGWIRTEGHVYLIEDYHEGFVRLPEHPYPISPSRALHILDQLVSVMRDCLHAGTVCHRDLKGENVLIDVESGDLIILDFGLATHFSPNEPKLTTCCGSPAFHSPEIVNALAHEPGEITYLGPEIDVWCIALTVLSLLLRKTYPLGHHHTSLAGMRSRVRDALKELDAAVVEDLSSRTNVWTEDEAEDRAWRKVRSRLELFLAIDGEARLQAFREYQVGSQMESRLRTFDPGGNEIRALSFIPSDPIRSIPLHLDRPMDEQTDHLRLHFPVSESPSTITPHLAYLLRSHGVLYHLLSSHPDILQLVLHLPSESPPSSFEQAPGLDRPAAVDDAPGWLSLLSRRSASVPPQQVQRKPAHPTLKKPKETYTRVWIRLVRAPDKPEPLRRSESVNRGGLTSLTSTLRSMSISPSRRMTEAPGGTGRSHSRLRYVVQADSTYVPDAESDAAHGCLSVTTTDPRAIPILARILCSETDPMRQRVQASSPITVLRSKTRVRTSLDLEDEEAHERPERGRPRSKEDPKLLEARVEAVSPKREVSRGRRIWDGLFGGAAQDGRSVSVPPTIHEPIIIGDII